MLVIPPVAVPNTRGKDIIDYFEIPAAVVFDCDGTLLDTDWCWAQAERTLFERFGRLFGPDERAALLGRGLDDAGRLLERMLACPGHASSLAAELGALADELIVSAPRLMRGAGELTAVLRERTRLAIASNTPRATVVAALARTPLEESFGAVVGADSVGVPKPDPAVYLEACEQLGVRPDRAIAIEDSPVGVQAARAAGMYVVGIPSIAGERLRADLVVASLEEPGLWRRLGLYPCPA